MADRASALIRETRAALSAAQTAWGAAGWAALAAPLAAVASFFARRLGFVSPKGSLVLWALAVLAAACAGAAKAFRRRIDRAGAALWLDRSLDDGELFSAALVCLERPEARSFDDELLERAEALAESVARPRPAPGALALRAAVAAAALGLSFLFLSRADAAVAPIRVEAGSPRSGAVPEEAGGSGSFGADARPSPKALAQSLFPKDARLAGLAEKAIREGKLDEVDDLVAKADADLALRGAEGGSGEQRKRLEAERERLKAAARAAVEDGPQGNGAREAAREEPDEDEREAPEQREGEAGGGEAGGEDGVRDDDGSGGQGGEGEPRKDPEGRTPPSGGGRGGADQDSPNADSRGRSHPGDTRPGTGAGRARSWGRIEGLAEGPEIRLPDDPRAALFDYLMPAGDPEASLSVRIEAAARSAEAAVSREDLPWEYGEYLKSYFLALTKAAAEVDRAREAEGAQR